MYNVVKYRSLAIVSKCKDNGLFFVVYANDGKMYQTKLHSIFQKGNPNELLGNYIAHKANIPSMNGNFISISDQALQSDIIPHLKV